MQGAGGGCCCLRAWVSLGAIRDAIAGNAKSVADFRAGKESALNAFKGPVMKAAKGKANPKLVDETLRRLLAGG